MVVAVGDVERSTAIADLEVEIAPSAVSSNPVDVELRHGSSVPLRARPLPGQDAAIAEAGLSAAPRSARAVAVVLA